MKSATTIATLAVLGIPIFRGACADSDAGEIERGVEAAASIMTQVPGDTGSIRELVDGIRGANPIQCELLLQAFVGWTTDVPDRDIEAWNVTQRLRRRITSAPDIEWLGAQMRGGDPCAARAAARLLGRSPAAAARAVLVSALTDGSPQVRRLGALGIGIRSDSTVNVRLVDMLDDADATVRAAAAWALGEVH